MNDDFDNEESADAKPRIVLAKKRNALEPPPTVWMIAPGGAARRLPMARNINTGVFMIVDGAVVLRPAARKRGWRILEDECTPEEWSAWLVYSAIEAKALGKMRIPMEHRPACLQKRTAQRTSARVYTPAGVKQVPKAESAKAPAPKAAPVSAPAADPGELAALKQQLAEALERQRAAEELVEELTAEADERELDAAEPEPELESVEPEGAEPKTPSKPAKKAAQKTDAI